MLIPYSTNLEMLNQVKKIPVVLTIFSIKIWGK